MIFSNRNWVSTGGSVR